MNERPSNLRPALMRCDTARRQIALDLPGSGVVGDAVVDRADDVVSGAGVDADVDGVTVVSVAVLLVDVVVVVVVVVVVEVVALGVVVLTTGVAADVLSGDVGAMVVALVAASDVTVVIDAKYKTHYETPLH